MSSNKKRKVSDDVSAKTNGAHTDEKSNEDKVSPLKQPKTPESDIQLTTSAMEEFPVVDLSAFLNRDKNDKSKDQIWRDDCDMIAKLLHNFGILIVKDPRVSAEHNDTFLDTMERYYEQEDSVKAADIRKDLFYQVGVTPTQIEKARDHCDKVAKLDESERPITECPPEKDPKCRFFWRMGKMPEKTEFKQLNAEPVIPAAFPEWPKVMNTWGSLILEAVQTVAEMAALGFQLELDAFTNLMVCGPHLLGPTGSDLNKFGKLNTVFASYHYDLNFLTIHGRSRFPGLFVWTRQGKKMMVRVPKQCLLLQAGKQFEWLTGGHVFAGFHEVVVCEATIKAMEEAKKAGRSLWRVSSTLFGHIASDNVLKPLGRFANDATLSKYPPTQAGKQVQAELDAIKLGRDEIAGMM